MILSHTLIFGINAVLWETSYLNMQLFENVLLNMVARKGSSNLIIPLNKLI